MNGHHLQVDFLWRNFIVSDIDMRINFTVIVVSSTNTAKGGDDHLLRFYFYSHYLMDNCAL